MPTALWNVFAWIGMTEVICIVAITALACRLARRRHRIDGMPADGVLIRPSTYRLPRGPSARR